MATRISAETMRLWETIAAQEGRNIDDLLREVGSSYFPTEPPTLEEREDAFRKVYAETVEARAEAWAKGLLVR